MKPLTVTVYELYYLAEIPPQVQQFDFRGSQSGQIIGNDGLSVFF